MNISCSNGNICFGSVNYQEQCEVYSGSNCQYPCDASNCEVNIELDTLCLEYYCTPAQQPKSQLMLILEIGIPILGLIGIGILVMMVWWIKARDGIPTPIIRNNIYRETTEPIEQPRVWSRIRAWFQREQEPSLLTNDSLTNNNVIVDVDLDAQEIHGDVPLVI